MSEEELKQAISALLGVDVERITIYGDRIGEIEAGSLTASVDRLVKLQQLVEAPVTIVTTASDHGCDLGRIEISWEPS